MTEESIPTDSVVIIDSSVLFAMGDPSKRNSRLSSVTSSAGI
ncbi:hypothetical protein [Natronococcus amylolyticus]|nr:hypothetical protein [Natronococcus amylolyticus]